MEQFKKLHSKSGFAEQIGDVISFLSEGLKKFYVGNPKLNGKSSDEIQLLMVTTKIEHESLKIQLNNYNKYIRTMYSLSYGKYPKLTAKVLNDLKEMAVNLKKQIDEVKKIYKDNHLLSKSEEATFDKIRATVVGDLEVLNRIELRGPLTLPQAVYKFSGKAYEIDSNPANKDKGVSFFEYSKIYVGKSKSEKSVIKEYMNTPTDQLMAKYKAEIDKNVRSYEYSTVNPIIPDDVLFTGDVAKIDNYLNSEAANNLTYPERKVLETHKNASNKSTEIKSKHIEEYQTAEKLPDIESGENYARIKVDLDEHQTSSQGCWSCAGVMLLKSKGISDVSQETIRAYRPKLEENAILNGELKVQYNSDTTGNVMDKGDSILAFAPDCMLKEIQVTPYGEDTEKEGYTLEQYINNTVAFLKKQIMHAIVDDHSAVAFLTPGHYITVTGIEGDTIEYKDSSSSQPYDHTFKMSLKAYVKEQFFKQKAYERRPVMIQWLADIKMAEDGTIYGVPSEYTSVKEDGSIALPPEDIQVYADVNKASTNLDGICIQRSGGKEQPGDDKNYTDGGIYKIERVYLPKKVDYKYLKLKAQTRDNIEKTKLVEQDKNFLGINRNNPHKVEEVVKDDIQIEIPQAPIVRVNPGIMIEATRVDWDLQSMSTAVRTMESNLSVVTPKWFFKPSEESIRMAEKLSAFAETLVVLGNYAIPNNNQDGIDEATRNADKCLEELITSVEAYLDYKNTQMLEDPRRRNASGKSKVEQPRIRCAIDMLDKLYAMRTALKVKQINKTDSKEATDRNLGEQQFRNDTIKEYKNALLSDKALNITPKMVQEATYKNQFKDLNADQLKKLEQYEALFGMTPDNAAFKGYKMATYIPKGSNMATSEFDKLKQITNTFKAIGSDDPMDRLSNKDFTAIAVAASLSRDVYNKMSHKVSYYEYQYLFINALSANNNGGVIPDLDVCVLSRQEAAKALTAYKNGDKKPLAHLIKAGLRSLGEGFYYHELQWDVSLYSSEMGKRLYSMLKRDPELFSLAKKDGLENRDIEAININEVIGVSGSKASYTYNACGKNFRLDKTNDNYPLYDPSDQIEVRTDMLMGRIFKDSQEWRKGEMEDDYKYQVAMMQSDIELYKYANKLSGDISKELKTAFADDPNVIGWINAYDSQLSIAFSSADAKSSNLDMQREAFEANANMVENINVDGQNAELKQKAEELVSKRNNRLTQVAEEVMTIRNGYMTTNSTENNNLLDKLNEHIKPMNKELNDLVKKSENVKLTDVEVKKVNKLKKKVAALNKTINRLQDFSYSITVEAGNLQEKVERKYKLQDSGMMKLAKISNKHALRKKVRDYVVKYGIHLLDSKKFIQDIYEKWSHRNVIEWIKRDKPFHGDISDIRLPKNDTFDARNVMKDEDRRVQDRDKKFNIDRTNKGGVAEVHHDAPKNEVKHGPKK